MLEILDLSLRSVGDGFCPECSAAWQATPFAGNFIFLDKSFQRVEVADLEGGNIGRGVEEERLAMASVLGTPCFYISILLYLLHLIIASLRGSKRTRVSESIT